MPALQITPHPAGRSFCEWLSCAPGEHLALLPIRLSEREAAVLCAHVEGNSYAEISEQLGASTKFIDNALQRARRKAAVHMAAFEDAA